MQIISEYNMLLNPKFKSIKSDNDKYLIIMLEREILNTLFSWSRLCNIEIIGDSK